MAERLVLTPELAMRFDAECLKHKARFDAGFDEPSNFYFFNEAAPTHGMQEHYYFNSAQHLPFGDERDPLRCCAIRYCCPFPKSDAQHPLKQRRYDTADEDNKHRFYEWAYLFLSVNADGEKVWYQARFASAATPVYAKPWEVGLLSAFDVLGLVIARGVLM